MSTNSVTFEFSTEPISVNKLYINLRGQTRRFLSTEGKKFKAEVKASVVSQLTQNYRSIISDFVGKPLSVSATISLPDWMLKTKKNTPRKKDLDNKCKALFDSMFETLRDEINDSLDDSFIWELNLRKQVSAEVKVTVEVAEYNSQL